MSLGFSPLGVAPLGTLPSSLGSSGVAENANATENTSLQLLASSSINESSSVTDTQSSNILTTATESGNASDSEDRLVVVASIDVAESGNATDAIVTQLIATAAASESGSVSDTINTQLTASANLLESSNAIESESSTIGAAKSIAESGSTTDSASALNNINEVVSENLVGTDQTSRAMVSALTISELGNATDNSSILGAGSRQIQSIDKVAEFAEQRFPQYILDDYATFVTFITSFLKYLEQDGYPRDLLRNSRSYLDIDATSDLLLAHFESQLASSLPATITANKVLLVKHIKDLYANRGNELGLKLFFKLVYNEEVNIYYPSTDMLRVSDGKWNALTTIFIKLNQAITLTSGTTIIGKTTNTVAVITSAQLITINKVSYYNCNISLNSNTFIENEEIILNNAVIGNIEPIITGLEIGNEGQNYSVGDLITIGDSEFRITSVSSTGGIIEITQIAVGLYFTSNINTIRSLGRYQFGDEPVGGAIIQPIVINTRIGTGAAFSPVFGAINSSGGSYSNYDGIISGKCKIQDSYYYQAFSYDISTKNNRSDWESSFISIMNPAGNIMFSTIPVQDLSFMPLYVANNAIVTQS